MSETGGSVGQSQLDSLLMNSFIRDANKAASWIEEELQKKGFNNDRTLRKFKVIIQGLKNSLWNIEEIELTELAIDLETRGQEQNMDYITEAAPVFLAKLRVLLEKKTQAASIA